jgi:uncharacterized protein (DUF1778 family)
MTACEVYATQPAIQSANSIVAKERRIIEDEREAYKRFVSRLEKVSVLSSSSAPQESLTSPAARLTCNGTDTTREVREAFRETVMAVPHYEREYGESLQTHLAAEVGPELAAYATEGTLTQHVYDGLMAGARKAIADRRQLLEQLHREHDSLREIETELNRIECDAYQLNRQMSQSSATTSTDINEQLTTYERTCKRLADDRQDLIHGRGPVPGISGPSLSRYLYAGLKTDCPALVDITDTIDTLQSHRQACQQSSPTGSR